jgi:hypothetical protein
MHIKQGGSDVAGKSPFAGAESPGTTRVLQAGGYVVSESDGPNGYAASISGACNSSTGAVTLGPGDRKTCTITNNDFAIRTDLSSDTGTTGAKITVVKGATVRDVATLIGAPANAGGSVAYRVYSDSSCTTLYQNAGSGNVGAGNGASASNSVTFNELGTFYWVADYSGNGSASAYTSKCGDETVTVSPAKPPRTPGYWKNHQEQTKALLPIDLGSYSVNTFARATAVFNSMNCGSSRPNDAVGCLAGHLLASKLNVADLGDACIMPVVNKANAFLKGESVTYAGITTTGVNYAAGPSGTYKLTEAQRSLAIALKNALDKYNNGGGCS